MIKHRHHIVPRYAGGDNSPENIVVLTIEEHAQAHLKLYQEKGDLRDFIAYSVLSGQMSHSEATRQAGILANKGKKASAELRQKMSEFQKALRSNPTKMMIEGAKKAGLARRGRKVPQEVVEKMRVGMKAFYQNNPEAAQEIQARARAASNNETVRGKIKAARAKQVIKHSDETKRKMSAAWDRRKSRGCNPLKGRKRPKEICEKIRQSHLGKTQTDECKEKISATRKEKFALGEYLDSYKRNPESGRFEPNLKGESK